MWINICNNSDQKNISGTARNGDKHYRDRRCRDKFMSPCSSKRNETEITLTPPLQVRLLSGQDHPPPCVSPPPPCPSGLQAAAGRPRSATGSLQSSPLTDPCPCRVLTEHNGQLFLLLRPLYCTVRNNCPLCLVRTQWKIISNRAVLNLTKTTNTHEHLAEYNHT